MSTTTESRNAAANAASTYFSTHLAEAELKSCVNTIKSAAAAVPAQGSFICAIFYWRIFLTANNKSFYGNAGGIGGVGGGSTNGDIYLANGVTMAQLQANTTSFQFNCAGVYLNVNFFDTNSNFLGSYQGGGVGTCPGTGGGTGSWS